MNAHTNTTVFSLKFRYVCRDIGGSDPERMAAPRVEEYLRELFKDPKSPVKVCIFYIIVPYYCKMEQLIFFCQ